MKKQKKKINISIHQEHANVICRDFDTFCKYILENKAKISRKTGCLGKQDCFELNRLLHRKEVYEKATRFQKDYPVINFFHYIAVKYEILELNPSGTQMIPGRNYQAYQKACTEEKYVFFLVNCLFGRRGIEDSYIVRRESKCFFNWKEEEKPAVGTTYKVSGFKLFGTIRDEGKLSACLEELMLIEVNVRGGWEGLEEVQWEIRVLPNLQPVFELYKNVCFEYESIWTEEEAVENYLKAYLECVLPGQSSSPLMELFSPVSEEIMEKTIDLKVSLRYYDCWRILRLDFSHSLYDLHRMIQLAFEFGDDHLFEFCIGNGVFKKTYTIEEAVTSGEELSVYETCLGQLGLREKEKFTYLFDFGDSWWFDLQVLKIMDGSVARPTVKEVHNKAPRQYPCYEEEDYVYSCIDENMEVSTILASISDELLEEEYAALLGYRTIYPEKISCKEMRREMENRVLNDPDRLLRFMTEEMRETLSELLKEESFERSDLCTIMKLYAFGFCMVREDEEEIQVPVSIKDIYKPRLKGADKLDEVVDVSEQIVRRCGVIEMEELYSFATRLRKEKMEYEEYVYLIFCRMHYFGKYYVDCFDGKEVISCYDKELTEKILAERLKPENADYTYPEFSEMNLQQLNAMPKAHEKWEIYVHGSLSIDWDIMEWLTDDFICLISSGIISKEEAVSLYKDTLRRAGSRITKKASGLIENLFDELPLAACKGNQRVCTKGKKASESLPETPETDDKNTAEKKEEYRQLSLFD